MVLAAKPVTAGDPSRLSCDVPRSAAMRADSSTDRPSAHRMAGRRGVKEASTTTTPCICPENPTACGTEPAAPIAWPTTERAADSHCAGSLSAQPGSGARTR